MKQLLNLFTVLMICTSASHCFAQDEVLKYDFTAWCNKDHSIYRVPVGASYGKMEIHFKNKGKELWCSIRMGEKTTECSFLYEKTTDIKVSMGNGLDYDMKLVEYWAKDQKGSFFDVIRLSLDRKELYYYREMILRSYKLGGNYEYKYLEQDPKKFSLIETKTEELPSWMQ